MSPKPESLVLLLLALIFVGNGCTSGLMSAQELHDNPIGIRPTDESSQEIIKAYFDRALKDAETARYHFTTPVPGKLWGGAINGGWVYGYLVIVDVNAKNSFGGYTGYQTWEFIIKYGAIQFVIPPESYHGLLM